MSRVGKEPVKVPSTVEVNIKTDHVDVKGPKSKKPLRVPVPEGISVAMNDGVITVTRSSDEKKFRALHGLTTRLIANAVKGVFEGFIKGLEIRGVGYKAQVQGRKLILNMGFSHPVEMSVPEGLDVTAEKPTVLKVSGADKQAVGEFAARIRRVRPPEPYKGKGIRYEGEHVRRKVGKTAAGTGS